jgi:hypothetical protein
LVSAIDRHSGILSDRCHWHVDADNASLFRLMLADAVFNETAITASVIFNGHLKRPLISGGRK